MKLDDLELRLTPLDDEATLEIAPSATCKRVRCNDREPLIGRRCY